MLSDLIRIVEFRTDYRVGKNPVDMVLLAPAGAGFEKTRTWHRIKDVMPPENPEQRVLESESYQALMGRWALIEPAYNAWKAGNELPESGTPLAAWAGVTAEQAAYLRKLGVRTVEDVAKMSELAVKELRWPGANELPKLAKSFLEGATAAAKDAELSQMRERMAAMEALLEEKMSAPEESDPFKAKPRRGRPPKVEEEAA